MARDLSGLVYGPAATAAAWKRRHERFYRSMEGVVDCVSRGAARRTMQKNAERMLVIKEGPRPKGGVVRHLCENDSTSDSPCCNPAHLVWGSPRDNAADGAERGNRNWQRDMAHPVNARLRCLDCGVVGGKMIMLRWHGTHNCVDVNSPGGA